MREEAPFIFPLGGLLMSLVMTDWRLLQVRLGLLPPTEVRCFSERRLHAIPCFESVLRELCVGEQLAVVSHWWCAG